MLKYEYEEIDRYVVIRLVVRCILMHFDKLEGRISIQASQNSQSLMDRSVRPRSPWCLLLVARSFMTNILCHCVH